MADGRSYLIKLGNLYECVSLEELINLDGVEDYKLIASFPSPLKIDKGLRTVEDLPKCLEKELKKDAYFREMLNLVLETYNIPYTNSRGEKTTSSLYVAVDRAYRDYLIPVDYRIDKHEVNRDPYGTKETVEYGIATILHRENVEKAFMSVSSGEVGMASLDNETKGQMLKLNEMRFVDYGSGNFFLRRFTPEEFCSWFRVIASYYSQKYKSQNRYSMLLDKSIEILREVASQKRPHSVVRRY